jgi:hypothetical protein
MATINVGKTNLSGALFLWSDLAIGSTTIPPSTTVLPSDDIFTGGAFTCVLYATTSSGSTDATIQYFVNSGTPGSATGSVVLTGASAVGIAVFNTTLADPYVSLNVESTGGGVITNFGLFILGAYPQGKGQHEATFGLSGMGTGTFALTATSTDPAGWSPAVGP